MYLSNKLNPPFRNSRGIIVVLALISILTVSMYSTSSQMVNAIGINELASIKGLSSPSLGNNCVTFERNNQQTVDNIKTFSNNQNSPIVSEIYNTNIETGDGGSNPTPNHGPQASNPIERCFQDFAIINQQYFQAVQNFRNVLPNDVTLTNYASNVGM